MRIRQLSSLTAVVLLSLATLPATTRARSVAELYTPGPAAVHVRTSLATEIPAAKPLVPGSTASRTGEFYGWWHDAGELLLHTSNYGFIGDWNAADGEPSAEWPAGTGFEHLYCAGLWVGARVGGDTLVSAAAYGMEFRAPLDDPVYTIYESADGAPGGEPGFDDDSDGLVDEDRLDGIDNDIDGAVDEDYAATSDEMFACVYFDTAYAPYAPPDDPHVPLSLEVYETSYAWSAPLFDDFVTIRYEITNIGQETLEEVYLGVLSDPDIGPGSVPPIYLDDRVAYLDKEVPEAPTQRRFRLQMAYCWDEPGGPDGTWDGHIGFMVTGHPTDPDGVVAPSCIGPSVYRSWYAGPDFPDNDAVRYLFMSQPMISPPAAEPQDWRFLLSVGPFAELAPGQATFLEVAVVCGQRLRGLVENASALYTSLEDATVLRRLEEPLLDTAAPVVAPGGTTLDLAPPVPNPMGTSARIAFTLPRRERVELSVVNCTGRVVATLVDGERGPGEHAEIWDGRAASGTPASSGVYVVRLAAGGRKVLRKLVLIR